MMLTVKQVAMRLNVSQSCIYQLVETGKIPHHRIGTGRGAIRFTEANLEEYLVGAQQNAAAYTPSIPSQRKLKHLKL